MLSVIFTEQIDFLETLQRVLEGWCLGSVPVNQLIYQFGLARKSVGALTSFLYEIVGNTLHQIDAVCSPIGINSPLKLILFRMKLETVKWIVFSLLSRYKLLAVRRCSLGYEIPELCQLLTVIEEGRVDCPMMAEI